MGLIIPFFFITGPAGTGKSYMIHLLIEDFKKIGRNYLLMAPTGIAAQNIGGSTIHSALRIASNERGFHTLAFHDDELNNFLLQIDTLIIDEVSMVSGQLLTYISELFEFLHKNNNPFGGINIILVGDLAQLPAVSGSSIYQSPIWKLFYPLFLREPQRQNQDIEFFNLLQKIRMGKIDNETWHLINRLICTMIPETIRIQPGARVMFLNNSQYQHRIANGTIGIVTDLDLDSDL